MKRQPAGVVDASVDAFKAESVNLSSEAIGARMKEARKALGLTQDALAALAGAKSKSGLQDNEAGKNMPGGQMIGALARAGINTNWLLTGEGPMLLAELQGAPGPAPALDTQTLAYVLEEVERVLKVRRLTLEPVKKAALIQILYDYCADTGKQEAGTVERFLKLVA